MNPEEYPVILQRHEQLIISIQKQLDELKEVQREIKTMNEALINLTNEIKFTNASLIGHEKRLSSLENVPRQRYEKIIAAIISSLVCGIIGYLIARFFG